MIAISNLTFPIGGIITTTLPLFFLNADFGSFRTVVLDALVEPWVLERLLGGDTLVRVVDEDLLQKVEELDVELGVRRNRVLQHL